ncbi:MAG TPA: hypothetical protein VKG43_13215, partial [Acidimicrobiales bacterium]|nr:hypothetical protein [Acidimicrobiales bacterium]
MARGVRRRRTPSTRSTARRGALAALCLVAGLAASGIVTTTAGASSPTDARRAVVVRPSTVATTGYDMVAGDGGVFVFGGAFYGSLPALGISVGNIVGIVASADERGYFLVGSDGGVFSFGDTNY